MLNFKNNHKLTSKGLEILGSVEALRKNIEAYPTYEDIKKRHSEHFKVKEALLQ